MREKKEKEEDKKENEEKKPQTVQGMLADIRDAWIDDEEEEESDDSSIWLASDSD